MAKVFITHPRTRNEKGELYPVGEQEVADKVASMLLKRGLAKPVEVATPAKAKAEADEKPKQESEAPKRKS